MTTRKSQQEPRSLSSFANDDQMLNAYKTGKDLYATIAQSVYHNKYEDNLEHFPDGSKNVEGATRRSNCKSILLGLLYGRGAASIAEQIGESYEEAQTIIDNFYKSFPKVKKWMDDSIDFAKKYGYVTDLWGRRRRLPDIQLPKYEIRDKKANSLFNPLLICKDREIKSNLADKYKKKLSEVKYRKDIEKIKQEALKDGIEIKDNSGFISQAERQCVNARIQGSAASMTKQAMLNIYNDSELNRLGFKLLINVHDELIGECPEENADECAKRLEEVMKDAAKDKCNCPFKCDADISKRWYENEYIAEVKEQVNNLIKKGYTEEDALEEVHKDKEEFSLEELTNMYKK